MVRVTMLAVGQGVSNLIEVYDNAGRMEQLILIDCGGDGFEEAHVRSSTELILDAMRARAQTEEEYDRYLDLLIISHQDEDHHSIIKEILETLEAEGQSIGIGKYLHFRESYCLLSGSYTGFAEKVRDCAEDIRIFPDGSAYAAGERQTNFYTSEKICLARVYANARGGNSQNSVSAVIEADINDGSETYYKFLFPGDATSATMNCICEAGLPDDYELYVMAAPHHGSISSCSRRALTNFLRKMSTGEIIISAGRKSQFGHPHCTFTEIAEQKITTKEIGRHCYRKNGTDTSTWQKIKRRTSTCLFTSYWPEGAYGEEGNGYYHYIYKIRQGIMDETFLRATAPRGDIFALSGMKKTRTTTKYWHATAAPGMAERR